MRKEDKREYQSLDSRLNEALAKIDLIATFFSNYKEGQLISADGIYFILDDATQDIREIFDESQERTKPSSSILLKKAA